MPSVSTEDITMESPTMAKKTKKLKEGSKAEERKESKKKERAEVRAGKSKGKK